MFFAIGFLLGGVVGVLIMCLLQINRIGRKEAIYLPPATKVINTFLWEVQSFSDFLFHFVITMNS